MNAKRNFAPPSETGARTPPTILVVDDEVLVRIAAAERLRAAGYAVIEAANAAEAIRLMGTAQRIDLVFSDIHMPGDMDGHQLGAWILRERPHIKVLLTTGTDRAAGGNGSGGHHVIGKPYDFGELERWIRELLGS